MSEADDQGAEAGQGPPPPAAPLSQGDPLSQITQLGRYKIARELGRGAMGVVFEAVDPKIGRKLAIKVLTSVPGVSEAELTEYKDRFRREAQTAGMLAHPNIVTIFDVGEEAELGVSYMAMEFLSGQSVYDLLRSGVKFTREQGVDICIQVAKGLDHAHRQGVIHRDVKPANLMLLDDGTIKITDFGIAKLQTSNLTRTGQFLGTPNYMSPEQVIGHAIDGRSDLFSLGIILYEMLTGEKPFMGSSLTTITYQIVNVDPIEPSKIQPGIARVYDDIVSKLLRKAPDERYQNGAEVAEVLNRAQKGGGEAAAATPAPPAARVDPGEVTQHAQAPPSLASGPAPQAAAPVAAPAAAGTAARGQLPLILAVAAVVVIVMALGFVGIMSMKGGDDAATTAGGAAGIGDPAGTPATATATPGQGAAPAPVGVGPEPGTAASLTPAGTEQGTAQQTTSGGAAKPPEPKPAQAQVSQPKPTPKPTPKPAPKPEPRRVPERVPVAATTLPLVRKPEPEPVAAAAVATARVNLFFEHKLKAGTLNVQVDGSLVGAYAFKSAKKKGGIVQQSFEVAEGSHLIQLCLVSDDLRGQDKCAQKLHRFVMNTNKTIRAKHQKVPMIGHKFYFQIE